MKRAMAIKRLIQNWRQLVKNGDFDAEEMRQSLEEQINGGCQGWDASLEELEIDPELAKIMGYGEELTDEQVEQWCGIVVEAAQKYLKYEALSADLDRYIAQHWTGGDENADETEV